MVYESKVLGFRNVKSIDVGNYHSKTDLKCCDFVASAIGAASPGNNLLIHSRSKSADDAIEQLIARSQL